MSVMNFDHPEEYLFPRWAPGSLAEAITQFVDGSLQEAAEEHLRRADAVEWLTKATRRVCEARNNLRAFRGPETKEKWDELWMAIEEAAEAAYAAEEWSDQ